MTKRYCAIALTTVLSLFGCTDSDTVGPMSAAVGGNREVVVSPSAVLLTPGATQQFSAQLLQNGVPKKATFVWSSSNASVATVSSAGLVTAIADGDAIITATTTAPQVSGTATVNVRTPPPAPVARFVFSCTHLSCTFNADSSSALPGASFVWTFGDSTAADSGRTPVHTYAAAGSYAVQLTVTDSGGSDDTTRVVTVTAPPPPPIAHFTYSCDELSCSFDATASQAQAGAAFNWNFGDSTAADTGMTAAHTYAAAGSYDVTLTVTDIGGTDDTTQTVTVTAPVPPPAIVATIPLSRKPFGSTVAPNGTGWVGLLDSGVVHRLDVAGTQLTGAVEFGFMFGGPLGLSTNADGSTIYAAGWSGLIGSINTQTLAVEHSVHLPINFNNASNIIATPAGDTVYVGMTSGEIYKVDLQNEVILASKTLPVAAGYHFAWNQDRTRLYASARDADGTPGRVYELDPANLNVPRAFMTNARPQGIAFSGDGALLYIANELGGVLVWNVAANTLAGTISTGCRGFGLVRRPDTGWLYVTCPLDGRAVVVDPGTGTTIATLATGGRPRRPSFDPATGTVIVPNESGWVDIVR